ncbi:hypothetical protein H9P43_007985 [Blastocladiella emersonii ATCC 22665]|nr:hypothetical protein H9P43_007985 [Blastocladiella emersonii ATCC 22665]
MNTAAAPAPIADAPAADAAAPVNKKKTDSSVIDVRHQRDRPFGGRPLTNEEDVFKHNSWDHVEMTEDDKAAALKRIAEHAAHRVDESLRDELIDHANEQWDRFYDANQSKFFKDRLWLAVEFPEIFNAPAGTELREEPYTIMEVGCGAGNTVYPVLREWKRRAAVPAVAAAEGAAPAESAETAEAPAAAPVQPATDPKVFIHACDYSSSAVNLVKTNDEFDSKYVNAFVYDLTSDELPPSVQPGSVDVLVLIFVFSALPPAKQKQAMTNVYKLLRPGGLVVFRDYAHMDLAQVRMKNGRQIDDNFYMRGDKTLVYFFTTDEVRELVESVGLTVEQLGLDHRLLVNRGKQLRMNRLWLQCKFRKPLE